VPKWFFPSKHALEQDADVTFVQHGADPEPGDTVEVLCRARVDRVLGSDEIELQDMTPVRIVGVFRAVEREDNGDGEELPPG
jgi:hypothetical protein